MVVLKKKPSNFINDKKLDKLIEDYELDHE